MTWLTSHPLSFLVFAPALLGFVILALPHALGRLSRMLGFMGALAVFALSLAWLLGHGGRSSLSAPPGSPWWACPWTTPSAWTA